MVKIAIVLGCRPEIIKMSPIIRYCEKNNQDYFIIDTGQHYSKNMSEIFFNELELPTPKYNLSVGSCSPGKQIGRMIERIEGVLLTEKPDIVLIQGDTNSVLSGALCANKLGIQVGHIEAGLRSYDNIPEEINRVITDHISDYLFCPTKESKLNAIKEGIGLLDENKIFVTGNTIVDAVSQNLIIAEKKSKILTKYKLKEKGYFLITAHRDINVDVKKNLELMFEGFEKIFKHCGQRMIYPIHPRTRKNIKNFGVKVPGCVELIEPVGYFDFLILEKNAMLILSDSGGIIEEGCILGVPCVTLRETTERPETLDCGSNVCVGINPDKMVKGAEIMLENHSPWKHPFGKNPTKKIMEILR